MDAPVRLPSAGQPARETDTGESRLCRIGAVAAFATVAVAVILRRDEREHPYRIGPLSGEEGCRSF